MNIRRHPLEEIQYFIIVNSIWVAQLLGKFVNACENKNTLINKGVTNQHIFTQFYSVKNKSNKKSCVTLSVPISVSVTALYDAVSIDPCQPN